MSLRERVQERQSHKPVFVVDRALERFGEELRELLEDSSTSAEVLADALYEEGYDISSSSIRLWRRRFLNQSDRTTRDDRRIME